MTYLVANSKQKRFQLVIHDDFVKTILITIYFLTNNMLEYLVHMFMEKIWNLLIFDLPGTRVSAKV